MPGTTSFLEQMTSADIVDPSLSGGNPLTSTSCPPLGGATAQTSAPAPKQGGRQRQDHPPPYYTEDQVRQWNKERQKKDNHNQSTCRWRPFVDAQDLRVAGATVFTRDNKCLF